MRYSAFLFDLNGTMVDDMQYHIMAWHGILNELGADISLERMKEECYGKNYELLERIFPGRFSMQKKSEMSLEKESKYREGFKPKLKLIPGLHDFLKAMSEAGIKSAIGSAAIMPNIDFVLDGLDIRKYIDVIVSADDVGQSKPDPETWLECIKKLNVNVKDCLVFEDSPMGAASAENAGLDCMIITTMHAPAEFEKYKNVIEFIKDFEDARYLCDRG